MGTAQKWAVSFYGNTGKLWKSARAFFHKIPKNFLEKHLTIAAGYVII
jgi:hypothetical protein